MTVCVLAAWRWGDVWARIFPGRFLMFSRRPCSHVDHKVTYVLISICGGNTCAWKGHRRKCRGTFVEEHSRREIPWPFTFSSFTQPLTSRRALLHLERSLQEAIHAYMCPHMCTTHYNMYHPSNLSCHLNDFMLLISRLTHGENKGELTGEEDKNRKRKRNT